MDETPRILDVPPPVRLYTATDDENRDRSIYQSARTVAGRAAPLPLRLSDAWKEAHAVRPV